MLKILISYDRAFQQAQKLIFESSFIALLRATYVTGERGGSVVECRTPEREVRGSRPTAAVLCP